MKHPEARYRCGFPAYSTPILVTGNLFTNIYRITSLFTEIYRITNLFTEILPNHQPLVNRPRTRATAINPSPAR